MLDYRNDSVQMEVDVLADNPVDPDDHDVHVEGVDLGEDHVEDVDHDVAVAEAPDLAAKVDFAGDAHVVKEELGSKNSKMVIDLYLKGVD